MIGAFVAAFCLALPPAAGADTTSPSDIAPIVGTWHDGGAVIKVTGGGGSFQGTVISGKTGACNSGVPGMVFWKGLSGSGFSYSGQIPFVHSDDCSSAGDGPATFTLSNINSGTWTATSPDGMQYSSSFTRMGTWPGADNGGGNKPKTNCKKNGKKVLCAGKQKKLVKAAKKNAKKAAKLAKPLKKAVKAVNQAKTPEKLNAAEEALFQLSVAGFNLVTGKWDRLGQQLPPLPTVQVNLPKDAKEWKKVGLPIAEKVAEKKWGDTRLFKLYEFAKEGDKTLKYSNELLQDADNYNNSSPSNAQNLNDISLGLNGKLYSDPTLTPEEKFAVASNVTDLTGAKNKLINHMVGMGEAGAKVTFSLPGKFRVRPR